MTTPLFKSLLEEMVDDIARDYRPPSGEPLQLSRDTEIRELPVHLSATLQNHHWKHEVRDDQHPA